MTEWLNWTELMLAQGFHALVSCCLSDFIGHHSLPHCLHWNHACLCCSSNKLILPLPQGLSKCFFLCLESSFFWFLCPSFMKVKVAQSCLTLCNPMDYTVNGILQARILVWVAFLFSKWSSQPRDQTQVSHTAGNSLPSEPQGKPTFMVFLKCYPLREDLPAHHV